MCEGLSSNGMVHSIQPDRYRLSGEEVDILPTVCDMYPEE